MGQGLPSRTKLLLNFCKRHLCCQFACLGFGRCWPIRPAGTGARRAEGIVAALSTSLWALQLDPLWPADPSSLVAVFVRSAAAKLIAFQLPEATAPHAAHVVVFRACRCASSPRTSLQAARQPRLWPATRLRKPCSRLRPPRGNNLASLRETSTLTRSPL